MAKHSNTIPKANFLRESWGWEGGGIFLLLHNCFISGGWKSFLQPHCSRELGAQPGKTFQMLPDALWIKWKIHRCIYLIREQLGLSERSRTGCGLGNAVVQPFWVVLGFLIQAVNHNITAADEVGKGNTALKALWPLSNSAKERQRASQAFNIRSAHWNSDLGLDSFARDPKSGLLSVMRIQAVLPHSYIFFNDAWIIAVQLEVKSDPLS